jgi:hypothetical protein
MIKTNLIYVYVGVNGTVVNNDFDFCIFLGYDPDELVWPPTVRMFVRTYMNNNVDDNEYELCESELILWLSERLK